MNCAETCVNGCILGDQCPHLQHLAEALKFVQETPMETILEVAEEGVRKKFTRPSEAYFLEQEQE